MMEIDPKREQILDAALPVFVRFGFRKTSMADIARAAGISRASLYLSYSSKEEVFRAGSMRAHTRTLNEVASVLGGEARALDRIEAAIVVFQRELIAPFGGSADPEELFAANMAIASDITLDARAELSGMLTQTLTVAAENDEIDLGPLQSPPAQLANVILAAIDGIKHAQQGASALANDTKLFMRLLQIAVRSRAAK